MSRILIDITRPLYRRLGARFPTGIDRVGLEYVRHYGPGARAVLSLGPLAAALSPSDSERAFDALLQGRDRSFPLAIELIAKASLWNWIMPGAGDSVLLNTSHQWLDYSTYAAQLRWLGVRPVFVICDLIPITHPEYCRSGERANHVARMRNAMAMARGIIAISQDTLDKLQRFAGDNGLRCPPAVVAPLAPGLALTAPGPRPVTQPYFVMVGTIEPRKNHLLMLHAWRRLVEQMGDSAPRLVIVGRRGWECENVVDLLERCEPLRGFVFEHNACGDEELATLLHHAQALLMPSFAEGYGLPVAEAVAAGVPVIASDLAVFREVAGNVPEYVDPLDGRRWAEMIVEYAAPDGARRKAQLERIEGFRPRGWAQHFAAVDAFLERMDAQPPA